MRINVDALPQPPKPERRERVEAVKKVTRLAEYQLSEELEAQLRESLQSKKEAIARFVESRGQYQSGDWQQWNQDFAKELGIEGNVRDYIRGFQEVIFRAEGLKGDHSAIADGQIGPYMLASLARFAGVPLDVIVPDGDRNPRLVKKMENAPAQEAQESAEEMVYDNPYQKPAPEGPWSQEVIQDYYSAYPGQEPGGGPQLTDDYRAEYGIGLQESPMS